MFENREQAAKILAEKIRKLKLNDLVILGLARGGVVVAWQIARILNIPVDTIVFKKIGAPQNPELAIGAVGSHGRAYLDKELISRLAVSKEYLKSEIKVQRQEAKRREILYRGNRKMVNFDGKNIIIADDGIATGATMLAAVKSILGLKPKSISLAIPVAPPSSLAKLAKMVDRIIVLVSSESFGSVGQYYRQFGQVKDQEVIKLLNRDS